MARFLIGLALLPSSAFALWISVRALGRLAAGEPSAWPFVGAFGLYGVSWAVSRWTGESRSGPAGWVSRMSRRLYVLGHELTHALAAWGSGAKVFGMRAGERGGHVEISRSNSFIALAPYFVPLYAVLAAVGYRAALWYRPELSAEGPFLALMGLALSFHLFKTLEVLWDNQQPDLAAAGGVVFSLALIGLANGVVLLAVLKLLFPARVALWASLKSVARRTGGFWLWLCRSLMALRASPAPQPAR